MTSASRPWLVPVGGFLGAGKTTLILAAARLLEARGVRTAVILNDQGTELVDTILTSDHGFKADQVAGGCFCCRFSDFIDAAERLGAFSPDVIFAEPVGSCTDLSATILQPLKRQYAQGFRLAPLTVLIDPGRAAELLSDKGDPDLAFLFRNQLAEADIVCFTKADLYLSFPALPDTAPRYLSAYDPGSVAAWIDEVLSGSFASGSKVLTIDYDRYARAEAALGWLNWSATLDMRPALSPAMLIGPLIDALGAELDRSGVRIVHLKTIDQADSGWLKAAVTNNSDEPAVEGALDASPARRHRVVVNLRALGDPSVLTGALHTALSGLHANRSEESLQCFRPSPPKPEREIRAVVAD